MNPSILFPCGHLTLTCALGTCAMRTCNIGDLRLVTGSEPRTPGLWHNAGTKWCNNAWHVTWWRPDGTSALWSAFSCCNVWHSTNHHSSHDTLMQRNPDCFGNSEEAFRNRHHSNRFKTGRKQLGRWFVKMSSPILYAHLMSPLCHCVQSCRGEAWHHLSSPGSTVTMLWALSRERAVTGWRHDARPLPHLNLMPW